MTLPSSRQMRKQRVLLEHEPHGPSVRRPKYAGIRIRPGVGTGLHAAMRWPGEAGDRAQYRCLATSRRPENREHITRVATEFDVEGNRTVLAKAHGEAVVSHDARPPVATASSWPSA